jgi:hypothetical protein
MKTRDVYLLEIRPEILGARILPGMSDDEKFQNETIRPIVKLQNELLTAVFKNYIHKMKNEFYNLTIDQRLAYIENAVQKNTKFRNSLKGIIIGQFTLEEYKTYIQNSSALNKRMMNIVKERLQSHVQLFEPVASIQLS